MAPTAYEQVMKNAKEEAKKRGNITKIEDLFNFLAGYSLLPSEWYGPTGGIKNDYSLMLVMNNKNLQDQLREIYSNLQK